MFWWKKKTTVVRTEELKELAGLLTEETKNVLREFQLEVNHRFQEVQAQLRLIDSNIEIIERKMLTKDMTDRQTYGHIHYKLEELRDLKKDIERKTRTKISNQDPEL